MARVFAILLRLLLVAAFVPILIAGTIDPTAPLLMIFLVLAGAAWVSLRLWASSRSRPVAFLIALAACAMVWSLATVSLRPVPQGGSVLDAP